MKTHSIKYMTETLINNINESLNKDCFQLDVCTFDSYTKNELMGSIGFVLNSKKLDPLNKLYVISKIYETNYIIEDEYHKRTLERVGTEFDHNAIKGLAAIPEDASIFDEEMSPEALKAYLGIE